jgi:V/A-type H+/Na+-transporting ATPase subunit E
MAEELKSLIERIQKDGVDKARAEANDIISAAKKQAEDLVKKAGKKAEEIIKQAEDDAKIHAERGARTMAQAARDVLIAVGSGVEKLFKSLISDSVGESLTPDGMMRMMTALAQGYAEHGLSESRIEMLISPEDLDKLKQLYSEKYAQAIGKGVEIRSDDNIIKGFKVSLNNGKVWHDFTMEAIADAMADFLRPQLEQIVREAAKKPLE